MTYRNLSSSGGNTSTNFTYSQNVYKHDGSGFYNWEQDNLPVLDLENRTDLLYSILGHPTASVDGVTFVLSGSIGGSLEEAHNNNIYTDIDDIVERIPRHLTFPVQIEICSYGNLGELNLANINCAKGGSIEIVNRNYGYDVSSRYLTNVSVSSSRGYAVQHIQGLSSLDVSSQIGGASSVKLGLNCYNKASWDSNAIAFAVKSPNGDSETDRLTVHKSETGINDLISSTSYGFELSAYSNLDDDSISTQDPLSLSGSQTSVTYALDRTRVPGGLVQYNSGLTDNRGYFLGLYGNYFTSVSIRNCVGNIIKLTNICVDGGTGNDRVSGDLEHTTEYGFNITDSEVILDNAASMRNQKAGFLFKNSSVSITGSMFAFRNYVLSSGSVGAVGDGIRAIGSEIKFEEYSSTLSTEFPNSGRYPLAFTKNGNGIKLVNSTISGGVLNQSTGIVPNGGRSDVLTTHLQAYQNSLAGIKMESSNLEFKGRLELFNNDIGIDATNSEIHSPQFAIDDNGSYGIKLGNTVMEYGYLCDSWTVPADSAAIGSNNFTPKTAYFVTNNGQNIYLDRNSSLYPYKVNRMPVKHGHWGGHGAGEVQGGTFGVVGSINLTQLPMHHHGETDLVNTKNLPGIVATNNSIAEFIHLSYEALYGASLVGVRGKVAAAYNNSKITFRGTTTAKTTLAASVVGGPAVNFTVGTQSTSWLTAGVYASNNSKIEFTGPTKISKFGIAALAEDSSEIAFNPPFAKDGSYVLDSSGYDLSNSGNHTACELHATRSVLVANKKSGITMFGLGGSALDPTNTTDRFTNTSYAGYTNFLRDTSGGSMKMMPNGFTSSIATETNLNPGAASISRTATLGAQETYTTGGMCVRAVGGSYVNVYDVNFMMEAGLAGSLSGAYYNYAGSGYEYYEDSVVEVAGSPPPGSLGSYFSVTAIGGPGGDSGTFVDSLDRPLIGNNGYTGDALGNTVNSTLGGSPGTIGRWGTRIHIWNISDNSRIQVTNCLLNGNNPWNECMDNEFHGPGGKWLNGAALDYYGLGGAVATYGNLSGVSGCDPAPSASSGATKRKYSFKNLGIFRLMGSVRGDVKSYFEVSADSGQYRIFAQQQSKGGTFADQVNAQGYQTINQDVSTLPNSDFRAHVGAEGGATTDRSSHSSELIYGYGFAASDTSSPGFIQQIEVATQVWDNSANAIVSSVSFPATPMPAVHCDWQGYLRNWLDESASHIFANAMHSANKKVNLLSIFRSTTEKDRGGEGRDGVHTSEAFGVGVRSLNVFDLDSIS